MGNGASSYRRFRESGDDSGLIDIIKEYRDGLIFYLNSIVGNIHTAEELAEDTFVLLGTRKPRDKGKGSFKTWLYTIGRNLALNYLKKSSKKREISLDDCANLKALDDVEQFYIREERKIILHKCMQKLNFQYRQVLWLVYFEDFSLKQVAAVMKISTHNAETLVYRARKSLKTQLETEGFIYEEL